MVSRGRDPCYGDLPSGRPCLEMFQTLSQRRSRWFPAGDNAAWPYGTVETLILSCGVDRLATYLWRF